jgi:hypothetical protein
MLNKSRIKRALVPRIKLRDIFRKVYWLEFENECILKFLAKYNVIMKRQENSSIPSKDAKIKDYVNATQRPEIIILVEE